MECRNRLSDPRRPEDMEDGVLSVGEGGGTDAGTSAARFTSFVCDVRCLSVSNRFLKDTYKSSVVRRDDTGEDAAVLEAGLDAELEAGVDAGVRRTGVALGAEAGSVPSTISSSLSGVFRKGAPSHFVSW